MGMTLGPRVWEQTNTAGTGPITLLGGVPGYQTFLAAFGNGALCHYTIVDGLAWEYGIGTLSGATLMRTRILNSSAGGSAISLSNQHTKQVYCAIPPECCANNGINTLPTNAPTPSVKSGRAFELNNTNPTTITQFMNGADGQEIFIVARNANTTIQRNSNIHLVGGSNYVMSTNDTLALLCFSDVWYEISRSVL